MPPRQPPGSGPPRPGRGVVTWGAGLSTPTNRGTAGQAGRACPWHGDDDAAPAFRDKAACGSHGRAGATEPVRYRHRPAHDDAGGRPVHRCGRARRLRVRRDGQCGEGRGDAPGCAAAAGRGRLRHGARGRPVGGVGQPDARLAAAGTGGRHRLVHRAARDGLLPGVRGVFPRRPARCPGPDAGRGPPPVSGPDRRRCPGWLLPGGR